jgi:hypothetical protein
MNVSQVVKAISKFDPSCLVLVDSNDLRPPHMELKHFQQFRIYGKTLVHGTRGSKVQQQIVVIRSLGVSLSLYSANKRLHKGIIEVIKTCTDPEAVARLKDLLEKTW